MEVIGKLTLLIGGLILALGCGAAFPQNMDAQQNSQQGSQPVSPQNSQQDAQKSFQQPPPQAPRPRENLAAMKQRMSERIQARIIKMQKNLDCIKSAQDEVSLRACLKEARNRSSGGEGKMRRGMGSYE